MQEGYDDFILLEARDRLGGRIWMKEFMGYDVEMGANWIHGLYNIGYDPDSALDPEFENPLWKFKVSGVLEVHEDETDYGSELAVNEMGEIIDSRREKVAWMKISESINECVKYSKELWDEYCNDTTAVLEIVEKKDKCFKDCVFDYINKDAPLDREAVALRDAILWEEIEFKTGIFNNSLMHSLPLNHVDRIGYDGGDCFVKNG